MLPSKLGDLVTTVVDWAKADSDNVAVAVARAFRDYDGSPGAKLVYVKWYPDTGELRIVERGCQSITQGGRIETPRELLTGTGHDTK